jgi:hypothetical protein
VNKGSGWKRLLVTLIKYANYQFTCYMDYLNGFGLIQYRSNGSQCCVAR